MSAPTLVTERLVLRPWREADVDAVRRITTDEAAARFIGGTTPPWQAFRTVCTFIGHWTLRGFGFFAVERRAESDCIGWCGPWKPEGWPGNEIGYSLVPEAWGQGYASEAAAASLAWAYDHAGWNDAMSCIDDGNAGSQGVARRLGATLEARDVAINDFVADIWRHLPPRDFLARFPNAYRLEGAA